MTPKNSPNTYSRRSIAKGAVWAAPVVAATSAIPAYAASGICANGPFIATSPGTGQAATTTTWTVPAGTSYVCFTVSGGGGGRSFVGGTVGVGGSGALIEGRIAVTAGQVLTLVVGAGGIGNSSSGAQGGGGYGNGGSVAESSATNKSYGASGGGSSAILLDGKVLVIAGGGGGGGNRIVSAISPQPLTANQSHARWGGSQVGTGGDAEGSGIQSIDQMALYTSSRLTSNGGSPGLNGAGGAGGTSGTLTTASEITYSKENHIVGGTGGSGFTAAGADGVTITNTLSGAAITTTTFAEVSGAGGGGYGGGGSGATATVVTSYEGTYGTELGIALQGAGGGGGGNYIDSSVEVSAETTAGNGATARSVRNPGAITLMY